MKAKTQNKSKKNDLNSIEKIDSERTTENRQYVLDLEASNRELEYLLYAISHDLRSSLRCIDGFSLALQEDYVDKFDSTANEYLQIIRTSTQQIGKLVDNILDLSRLSRMDIHIDKVDLSKLANETVEELKRNQPGSDVIFVIADQINANGDEKLLKLVLQNLIENAFTYTKKQNEPRIEFGVTDSNGDKAYFVRDNSVDMDKKYDNKNFSSSPRNNKPPEELEGTGVGLAAVQLMINRLGGRVWVEKNSGQGSTFFFTVQRS